MLWESLWLSLNVASLSASLVVVFALLCSYALRKMWPPLSLFFECFLLLPLVMPPVALGYLLLLLFGKNSALGKWLWALFEFQISFSFTGAVLAALVVSFPIGFKLIKTGLCGVDKCLHELTTSLGATRRHTFLKLYLPAMLPSIVASFVLCFSRSLGEFGATLVFAGNVPGETQTLSLLIWSALQTPDQETALYKLLAYSASMSLAALVTCEWLLAKKK